MIKKLIKKEKKQLIALFISLISLIIFSLLDNKIDKIFLFFFIGGFNYYICRRLFGT